MRTLFHETVDDDNKYLTVAVTLSSAPIDTFEELRDKKACFPTYDGVSWNTVKHYLFKKNLIKKCSLDQEMGSFFGQSCTPGLPNNLPQSLVAKCQESNFDGEFGALHCLTSGVGDVAFVSYNSVVRYVTGSYLLLTQILKYEVFRIHFLRKIQACYYQIEYSTSTSTSRYLILRKIQYG